MAQTKLTEQEISDGWKLLFDGQTTKGWRNFKKQSIGSSWKVEDGSLMLEVVPAGDNRTRAKDGGDIITVDQFENYELMLEWKISECGNSGIIFNVSEDGDYDTVWQTGPEMQVLDNNCHPDAKIKTHRAGDLYDLISCSEENEKPVGEWNQVKIVADQGNFEFWLNGLRVVTFEMFTPEWEAMVKESKFANMPGFGKYRKGHIALQDHGDAVWFRNIKIREI